MGKCPCNSDDCFCDLWVEIVFAKPSVRFTAPRNGMAVEGLEFAEAAEALVPEIVKDNPTLLPHEAYSKALNLARRVLEKKLLS